MPPPFREMTIAEFADLLERFPFSRIINSVHMHHTWRPRHADYRGRITIEGMWRHHTRVNGWSDIAQHITIAPDGSIWTGRGWNEPPASAASHNGTRLAGPFMFEMIGDFDRGRDPFQGPQLNVAVEVIARVQMRFDLPAESLFFHSQLSQKTCPGSSISYEETLAALRALRASLEREPSRSRVASAESPFSDATRDSREKTYVLIEALSGEGAGVNDPLNAEPAEEMSAVVYRDAGWTKGYSLEEIRARSSSAAGGEGGVDAGAARRNNRTYEAADWLRGDSPSMLGSRANNAPRGQRRALCVGINTYPTAPLSGCVADAQEWADALRNLGFDVSMLIDEHATYDAILQAFSDLVQSGTEGDVLVFQYAGHGTNVPNEDGDDEIDDRDEALCPHDFASGALIIDDDVADIIMSLREGVNLTAFMDCCFSQTNTRFAIGPTLAGPRGGDTRPRLFQPTPELEQAHAKFRDSRDQKRLARPRQIGLMKNVSFAACLDHELAWETLGHGDFTRIAVPLLLELAGAGITNEDFLGRVVAAFGTSPRQHPKLDSSPAARGRLLLHPPRAGNSGDTSNAGHRANGRLSPELTSVAQALRAFAALIEANRT
jgi:hypothetical protein